MDFFLLNSHKHDGKRPQITRLPQSSVVDRLKDFLPEMAAANAELDQQIELSPEKYDIENVSESDEQVIEMNIAVFERDDSSTSSDESDEDSDVETSDGHNSDTDSLHCEEHKDSKSERTTCNCELPRIKMPKPSSKCRSRPCVEVLPSSDSDLQDKRNDQLH